MEITFEGITINSDNWSAEFRHFLYFSNLIVFFNIILYRVIFFLDWRHDNYVSATSTTRRS